MEMVNQPLNANRMTVGARPKHCLKNKKTARMIERFLLLLFLVSVLRKWENGLNLILQFIKISTLFSTGYS